MDWLQQNSYVLAWVAVLLTALILLFRSRKDLFGFSDWLKSLACIAFLAAMAIAFTPSFDRQVHTCAWYSLASLVALSIFVR
jgi:hypothetical protein